MAERDKYRQCLNCGAECFSFKRGYCLKCYRLNLKIEKFNEDILPDFLKDKKYYSFKKIKSEYIRQIKLRLEIIKDSRILKDITAHDLEYRINGTLKFLGQKSLGKINDPIASFLKDKSARSYVYQLFSEIQLLKPFKVDYDQIYKAGRK